jgi:predicted enzyme related to lactoylglutathione lyase
MHQRRRSGQAGALQHATPQCTRHEAICGLASDPDDGLPLGVPFADVQKTLVKAEKGGAKVVLPVMNIGKNGIIGIFVDPAGAMLGVWSKAKPPKKRAKKSAKKRR